MTSALGIGGGAFLIILALIVYFSSLSSLEASVDTSPGSALENQTAVNKTILGTYGYVFAVLPYMLFGIGVLLLWKG